MPTYEFYCQLCKQVTDHVMPAKLLDEVDPQCDKCSIDPEKPVYLVRKLSAPTIIIKSKGF